MESNHVTIKKNKNVVRARADGANAIILVSAEHFAGKQLPLNFQNVFVGRDL